ncbi:glycosyltransferase [Aeromicrobium duanguangcaii]|uniref:Glycosyltransferase n=1 Tax=Aeromicrobium duanguangcaii TaxID=2968086 RepID=A0ABY5KD91_9ACTN|nr:glycosyltransferase [Aeromicrobium duanguangcaii]MCD9154517.1 glycosyltransferase [Aeromicrobium duanguangcaii]MCL3838265.1 glycosyltransferase [Aeromicrobium duanguangcaii]UUI68427.1 glycosyltransferase [Aeromicrobium duanguangcaii]
MTTLLAHEWLAPIGGSENVFEELSQILPTAHRMCLWNDAPERFSAEIEETWLARSPLRRSKALAYPFLSDAWKRVDLDGVDRVVVSSHASSHYLASRAAESGIASFAYVHTPPRYVWAPEFDARGDSRLARAGRAFFKGHDRRLTSQKVAYAANSEFIRRRMREAWGVDAHVIHPPVDVETIQSRDDWRTEVVDAEELTRLDALPPQFVLGASRLVEYKRLDAAIDVAEALGLPAVIAGSGPHEAALRALAAQRRVPVTFFGHASTPALHALYQAAGVFVFMAVEDFGIMPVEAMSLGTPVVVSPLGGARESVEAIGGGVVHEGATYEDLPDALSALEVDPARMADRARQFSRESFGRNVRAWLGSGDSEPVT